MKKVVVYARYSSDSQTEQSIEGQLRVCKEYAKKNDLVIVNEYIDRAMTGTNDHRPAFQQMLIDINKKAWDFVIVYKLDRFSRNKYETANNKKILKDNNIKLISAMENIPDTPEGIILENLLEDFVVDIPIKVLNKPKNIETIITNLMIIQKEQNKGSELLMILLKEKSQCENLLNNVMKTIEQGIINNTPNKRMTELEMKIEDLDKQILIEQSKSKTQLQENEIKDYYIKALKLNPAMLINYIIDYIKVYDDKLEIHFTSPLFENSDKEFSFLSITKKCPIFVKTNHLCDIKTFW